MLFLQLYLYVLKEFRSYFSRLAECHDAPQMFIGRRNFTRHEGEGINVNFHFWVNKVAR